MMLVHECELNRSTAINTESYSVMADFMECTPMVDSLHLAMQLINAAFPCLSLCSMRSMLVPLLFTTSPTILDSVICGTLFSSMRSDGSES